MPCHQWMGLQWMTMNLRADPPLRSASSQASAAGTARLPPFHRRPSPFFAQMMLSGATGAVLSAARAAATAALKVPRPGRAWQLTVVGVSDKEVLPYLLVSGVGDSLTMLLPSRHSPPSVCEE